MAREHRGVGHEVGGRGLESILVLKERTLESEDGNG